MTAGLESLPVHFSGLLGSLVAGLCTGVGALPIFLGTSWSERSRALLLSFAGGVMLGATFFSLLLPAIEEVQERTGSDLEAGLVTAGGLLLGALAIWFLDTQIPHEHFVRGPEGQAATIDLGRHWLFILAITLHNFPEGLSVGVAYGSGAATGLAVTLGIGLQNLPEGLAVAAALVGEGFTRRRAFLIALGTGMVEPVGGLVGAVAVSWSQALLPWGLAFAGGAMLFVIAGEIIPETHQEGFEKPSTFALVVGCVVMMLLDLSLG